MHAHTHSPAAHTLTYTHRHTYIHTDGHTHTEIDVYRHTHTKPWCSGKRKGFGVAIPNSDNFKLDDL